MARTQVQSVAGLLNSTGSPTYQSPSAVSIGTAANVLVFVGPSAADVPAYSPFYENTLSGNDNLGITCDGTIGNTGGGGILVSLTDNYIRFRWTIPMLVKKCSMRVQTGTGSGTSAAYARIYQINSLGRPGKLLVDFGAFSAANCLNASTTTISTTTLSNGFLLLPGEYFFDFVPQFSTGSPAMLVRTNNYMAGSWALGSVSLSPVYGMTATSGTAGAAPDPANTTGYAAVTNQNNIAANLFMLNVS